jgi:hypothetical protein
VLFSAVTSLLCAVFTIRFFLLSLRRISFKLKEYSNVYRNSVTISKSRVHQTDRGVGVGVNKAVCSLSIIISPVPVDSHCVSGWFFFNSKVAIS